jgi:sensor histidine kinase YesM
MLKGYNKDWNEWSERRRAVYTNLPPGDYTLCVEAYNLRTLDQAEALNFAFKISNPWWKLWYLNVLGLVILLALAVLLTRKYTETERNKQQRKTEIEKKIAELEMQALQAQMNPHFIFNCMNGIQYFVLANKMDEVLAYLSDFSKVVSQSLGSATLRMVSLEQEVDFLKSYLRLEQMRFPDKFDYDIKCCEGDDASVIFLPPMLIQPFAENAIRHGFVNLRRKGHISIEFEKKEKDLLKCSITDNGIGREKARLKTDTTQKNDRTHSGTITETRIRLFNSTDVPCRYKIVYTDLTDNGKPQGLMVELYLPMETGGSTI